MTRIIDVASQRKPWVPIVDVMGVRRESHLYAELVMHAGLRLGRTDTGKAIVAIREGSETRFIDPDSPQFREFLDRHSMTRGKPLPSEAVCENLSRLIRARVSSPDFSPDPLEAATPTPPDDEPEAPAWSESPVETPDREAAYQRLSFTLKHLATASPIALRPVDIALGMAITEEAVLDLVERSRFHLRSEGIQVRVIASSIGPLILTLHSVDGGRNRPSSDDAQG